MLYSKHPHIIVQQWMCHKLFILHGVQFGDYVYIIFTACSFNLLLTFRFGKCYFCLLYIVCNLLVIALSVNLESQTRI